MVTLDTFEDPRIVPEENESELTSTEIFEDGGNDCKNRMTLN